MINQSFSLAFKNMLKLEGGALSQIDCILSSPIGFTAMY